MNHQKLKCYGRLMGLAKKVPNLMARIPRGEGYLMDQLKRALSSAILNLAEGNGRRSFAERKRFLDIALASLSEVSAIMDILVAYRILSIQEGEGIKEEVRIAYAMIFQLRKVPL